MLELPFDPIERSLEIEKVVMRAIAADIIASVMPNSMAELPLRTQSDAISFALIAGTIRGISNLQMLALFIAPER
jgi:hypothetical protein